MKKYHLLSLFILSFFLIISSCDTAGDDDAIISGQVTDATTGDALSDATVAITSPDELSDFARTNEEGNYEISGINVNDVTSVTLTASFTDYNSLSKDLTLTPGATEELDFKLSEAGSDDGGDNGGGDDQVSGEPEGAAAIVLESLSSESINIRQTGGDISSRFTFTVVDSAGRAINSDGAVDVQFSILKGTGGGETVIPSVVRTNPDGQVVTSLISGDSAGVVRIRALIDRSDIGITIVSDPILVAINGGFPAPDRFFIASENRNLEGYGINTGSLNYDIIASVGDKFGNPVKIGTAVDFRTNAGIIEGSELTDEFGIATVRLRPDGSRPNTDPLGTGFFSVYAKTVDENNDFVNQELKLLFTTSQALISVTPNSVNIPANGSQTFTYTVTDLNGNPMSAGSQISVSVATGLEASGDIGFTLNDYTTTGAGKTQFGFTVSDTDDENSDVVGTSITITVVSAGTGSTTSLTITGNRAKAGGWTFNPSNTETEFIEGRR
ncbi:MAG: carboxypeptidase regulatory-like domain-containing protein [Balneola sp.]